MPLEIRAFVLMPFAKEFDDVYRLGIQDTARTCGIIAERLDEQIFAEGMMDRLYQQIDHADLIIADMTGRNPNVFYEVGYADAKDKLCILITADANDIPFDLKDRRHIVYGNSLVLLRERLTRDLLWARGEIETRRSGYFRVDCHALPLSVQATEYSININLDLQIDLFNDSVHSSVELSAIYLYASDETWRFIQEGKPVPYTEANEPGYVHRHFLQAPIARFDKGSWARIQLGATCNVASRWAGDTIPAAFAQDVLLRLATSSGPRDHLVPISCTLGKDMTPPVDG